MPTPPAGSGLRRGQVRPNDRSAPGSRSRHRAPAPPCGASPGSPRPCRSPSRRRCRSGGCAGHRGRAARSREAAGC
ncbi:hypothetical protein TVNIR_0612 [Thioalkalivibrio nitratireducens DSM 14787]|uniref:Uncharacterized protein n=1 Tax=Thioalkalivibrio nitratireducens (strain DSM 14787 / UNIQEM 213 / ALEN2) TaxID=1255043 RepID=L0DTH3_THIND|nr:hypothetical protein TVNIR_0612 [Thioalkalivibrio nitratireducens DSM 14787]